MLLSPTTDRVTRMRDEVSEFLTDHLRNPTIGWPRMPAKARHQARQTQGCLEILERLFPRISRARAGRNAGGRGRR